MLLAQPLVYMGFHAGMATAAVCTAVIWFHSYWAHTMFLAAVLLMAAYNGATYYFKIFANRCKRPHDHGRRLRLLTSRSACWDKHTYLPHRSPVSCSLEMHLTKVRFLQVCQIRRVGAARQQEEEMT